MENPIKKKETPSLFSDNPSNRTQEIIHQEDNSIPPPTKKKESELIIKKEVETHNYIPETLPKELTKTIKDVPQSTRSSRVSRMLAKLDSKDRKIVKGITEGKEDKEVLKSVGYSDSYIKNEGKRLIDKPVIQSAIAIIMENTGITDEFLAGKLKEGMDATKLHGTGSDMVETDDFTTRHKYIETGLKLKGHLDKKVDITHHKSHEDQLRELQGGEIVDADYEEILPD